MCTCERKRERGEEREGRREGEREKEREGGSGRERENRMFQVEEEEA